MAYMDTTPIEQLLLELEEAEPAAAADPADAVAAILAAALDEGSSPEEAD
jgi:hypothetical protein